MSLYQVNAALQALKESRVLLEQTPASHYLLSQLDKLIEMAEAELDFRDE